MLVISVLVLSSILLLAMVFNLILKPEVCARISAVIMFAAVIYGLLIYGTGFAQTTGSLLLSVIKTPAAVLRMFVGSNELSSISGSFFVRGEAGILFFWVVHLVAFYSTASAVMFTLGARLLRQLRLVLSRRGDLVLIYGISEDSVRLGKDCLSGGDCSVVLAAEKVSDDEARDLNSLGLSVIAGYHAAEADPVFLRRLHPRKRKLSVYLMEKEPDRCLAYALKLMDSLEKAGVSSERTRISLPGAEEIIAPMLQVSSGRYGFGFVHVFDRSTVSARAMIRTCPPWDMVSFNGNGKATEDFSCAVIGFGRHGQAALRQLAQNGQFYGSTFHADVFSPNMEKESGSFLAESPGLVQNYDIRFHAEDARSRAFYDFLEENLSRLKIIAVCTGTEEGNGEICDNLMLFLQHRQAEHICVVQCGRAGARFQKSVGSPVVRTSSFAREFLSAEVTDRNAVILNAAYDSSSRSDWEKWVDCPSFGRLSSRAAADFLPAYVRMAGLTPEEIRKDGWNPSGELLESLARTEHLRWMAFYYVSGYTAMTEQQIRERNEEIRRCRAEGSPCRLSLTKDPDARLHACLIPWEELDGLEALEEELTGRRPDYRDADRRNVLTLSRVLKEEA